jgi:hypothetical protein
MMVLRFSARVLLLKGFHSGDGVDLFYFIFFFLYYAMMPPKGTLVQVRRSSACIALAY